MLLIVEIIEVLATEVKVWLYILGEVLGVPTVKWEASAVVSVFNLAALCLNLMGSISLFSSGGVGVEGVGYIDPKTTNNQKKE